jgi:hypothetical protein
MGTEPALDRAVLSRRCRRGRGSSSPAVWENPDARRSCGSAYKASWDRGRFRKTPPRLSERSRYCWFFLRIPRRKASSEPVMSSTTSALPVVHTVSSSGQEAKPRLEQNRERRSACVKQSASVWRASSWIESIKRDTASRRLNTGLRGVCMTVAKSDFLTRIFATAPTCSRSQTAIG